MRKKELYKYVAKQLLGLLLFIIVLPFSVKLVHELFECHLVLGEVAVLGLIVFTLYVCKKEIAHSYAFFRSFSMLLTIVSGITELQMDVGPELIFRTDLTEVDKMWKRSKGIIAQMDKIRTTYPSIRVEYHYMRVLKDVSDLEQALRTQRRILISRKLQQDKNARDQ